MITRTPSMISYMWNFSFLMNGEMSETKNAIVLITTSATETLEALMLEKKHTQ